MPHEYGKIVIGNNCFVGTNAMITKGVIVGNHCLIGANAVVTKSCPDFSIILGIPGKICGKVLKKGDEIELQYF